MHELRNHVGGKFIVLG